jgi:hypothetical protein
LTRRGARKASEIVILTSCTDARPNCKPMRIEVMWLTITEDGAAGLAGT